MGEFGILLSLAKKDFRSYFTSPIGYVVLAALIALIGWNFFYSLSDLIRHNLDVQMAGKAGGRHLGLGRAVVLPFFRNLAAVLMVIAPLLTMRLFSEERKQQTLPLLLSAPLSYWQIIGGKFTSAMLFVVTLCLLTLIFPLALVLIGDPDPGPIVGGYIGTLLLGAFYIAIGTFYSSLTENQIVAGTLTFSTELLLAALNAAANSVSGDFLQETIGQLAIERRFSNFALGNVHTADIVFFASGCSFFLFLTYRSLESTRWR